MAKHPILVGPLLIAILFVGCLEGLAEPTVKLTFENETDATLCFNLSPESAATDEFCSKVKSNGKSVWRPECGLVGNRPLTIVLTLAEEGQEVYNRTATCDEWKDSGGEITIVQREEEFVVTDGLLDATPTP